ncbi:uncharacterized protein isoform X5 [Danio rerio]|uniref:Uncharacterized protein isoform X5 n=1 Tax=Danio rerio TaxID=7955 RepID=A0AC58HK21_DANRE
MVLCRSSSLNLGHCAVMKDEAGERERDMRERCRSLSGCGCARGRGVEQVRMDEVSRADVSSPPSRVAWPVCGCYGDSGGPDGGGCARGADLLYVCLRAPLCPLQMFLSSLMLPASCCSPFQRLINRVLLFMSTPRTRFSLWTAILLQRALLCHHGGHSDWHR